MQAVRVGAEAHPVEVYEPDVGNSGGDPPGVQAFVRIAPVHTLRYIQQDADVKVLLLEEQLDEEFFESRVDVPIEKPQVVPEHVAAVVGELDGLSASLADPFTAHLAGEYLAAHQRKLIELGHELGAKKLIRLGLLDHGHAAHTLPIAGITPPLLPSWESCRGFP